MYPPRRPRQFAPAMKSPIAAALLADAGGSDSEPERNSSPAPTEPDMMPVISPGKSPFIALEGLVMGESPYVSLDVARLSALSPSARTSFPTVHEASEPAADPSALEALVQQGNIASYGSLLKIRLPNTSLNFDLRTLKLHLTMRLTELMQLKETMWEWVVTEQSKQKKQQELQGQSARERSNSQARRKRLTTRESLREEMLQLNRDDLNVYFARFKM